MIIGIHQPNFLPWLGFFYKLEKSDVFIFLDSVQLANRGYTNRVKVKNMKSKSQWITVPVSHKGKSKLIFEAEISDDAKWKRKLVRVISNNYNHSQFYSNYSDHIFEIIMRSDNNLCDLNIELISYIVDILKIKTKIVKSSSIACEGSSTDLLINLCKAVGGNEYLSGFGGNNYQDEEKFKKNGIKLSCYNFIHPEYKQCFNEFMPGLSVIDLLFNCGTNSESIIKSIV